MNHLDKVIKSVRSLRGEPDSDGSRRRPTGKLAKAIESIEGLSSLRKARPKQVDIDLMKGAHDAMYHHACHAAAAQRACPYDNSDTQKKCKEAAKKHTFMFLRHALENARDRDAWAMRDSLQRAMTFYQNEASDEMYANGADVDPYVLHFKNGGEFVPHPDDKAFIEDYEGNPKGPDTTKKGK